MNFLRNKIYRSMATILFWIAFSVCAVSIPALPTTVFLLFYTGDWYWLIGTAVTGSIVWEVWANEWSF